MDEKLIGMLEQVQSSLNNLNEKVNSNQKELIEKLNSLENNQGAITRYIINSDDAF